MAEVKTYICDSCGKPMYDSYDSSSGKVYIPVGIESCPAGGAGIENHKSFDICPKCLTSAVNEFLNKGLPYDYNAIIAHGLEGGRSFRLYLEYTKP